MAWRKYAHLPIQFPPTQQRPVLALLLALILPLRLLHLARVLLLHVPLQLFFRAGEAAAVSTGHLHHVHVVVLLAHCLRAPRPLVLEATNWWVGVSTNGSVVNSRREAALPSIL